MSQTVRFGVAGFGFIGKIHAMNIKKHPDAKLSAVFSLEEDKAEVESLGAKFFDDWKAMLDEDLDAVVVGTPTYTHADLSLAVIEKGMHLFLEKPMERVLEKCEKINEAAKNKGIKLGMAHVLRFDPEYIELRNKLHAGTVGTAKMIRCTRRGPPPGWGSWFFEEAKSGTVILDLSIHDIDYICWTAGKVPRSVCAMASKIGLAGQEMFGISNVVLEFERSGNSNVDIELGFAEASWGARNSYPFSTSVEVSSIGGFASCKIPGKHPIEEYTNDERVASNLYTTDGYYNEIDDFVMSIINDRPPKVSGDEGMMAVKICLAALQSARESKVVTMEGFK
ncbi:MAG: Gfo/Idh/MocA family protein [Candidatus Hodarchaeota archaeon]